MIHFVNRNAAGGRAYFLPNYTPAMMQTIMREATPVWDVAITEPMSPVVLGRQYAGSLTYIHKVKDGREIYLFANSSDKPVDSEVALRGKMDLDLWDPMNGQIRAIEEKQSKNDKGQELTTVPLRARPGLRGILCDKGEVGVGFGDGLPERGRPVRTGFAGILPARRASCPAFSFGDRTS